MQPAILAINSRYTLELQRTELLQQKYDFERTFGTFLSGAVASVQSLALVADIAIVLLLNWHRIFRTRTNLLVSWWAILHAATMAAHLWATLPVLVTEVPNDHRELSHVVQMVSALGRTYGTILCVVWWYLKCFKDPTGKFAIAFLYFLMVVPSLICAGCVVYNFKVYRFMYEAYVPHSDILNVVVYGVVLLLFVMMKMCGGPLREVSNYALLISIVNLVVNLPMGLSNFFVMFVLDISWTHWFHVHFVSFFIDVLTYSSAFLVLHFVIGFKQNTVIKTKIYLQESIRI